MSFTRLPIRALFRQAAPLRQPAARIPLKIRHASTSSRSRGQPVQSMTGLTAAGLGLLALFGWSAVILSVEGRKGQGGKNETVAHAAHVVKDKVQDITSAATEAVTSSDSSPSSPKSATPTSSDEQAENGDHSQSAAYDPETGEINWDCPCLGGMAHGPCGEEFKAAFSCFVHSEEEVKGVDCVDKFRGMQECFRKHPDVYGTDADEEEDDEFDLIERAEAALKDDEEFEPVVKA